MTPEYLEQLADIADPDQLWRLRGSDQQILDAAEQAGFMPNTIGRWMGPLRRLLEILAGPAPSQEQAAPSDPERMSEVLAALVELRKQCADVSPFANAVTTKSRVKDLRRVGDFMTACEQADVVIAAAQLTAPKHQFFMGNIGTEDMEASASLMRTNTVCVHCGDKRCVHAKSNEAPCATVDLRAHNLWVEQAAPQDGSKAPAADLFGFSREDLPDVAEALDTYERTINVGNTTGEGDTLIESTTAYAARFIRAALSAAPISSHAAPSPAPVQQAPEGKQP